MVDYSLLHNFSFVAVFIASLAGSLHCVGMCGGLVIVAGTSSRGPLLGQLGYNIGRGCSYALLGALSGAFGERIIGTLRDVLMPKMVWSSVALLAAVLIACALAVYLTRPHPNKTIDITRSNIWTRLQSRAAAVPVVLGMGTALLPCPWLYSFVALAAISGDPALGMKIMTAFWLGTIPALVAVGTIFESAARAILKRYPHISIISLVVAFLLSVSAHLSHNSARHAGYEHHRDADAQQR